MVGMGEVGWWRVFQGAVTEELVGFLRSRCEELVWPRGWTGLASQPDGLRRSFVLGKGKWQAALLEVGAAVLRELGRDGRHVYKPALLGTAPGAAAQEAHQDARYPSSWSMLVALTNRQFYLYDMEGKVRRVVYMSAGDVLLFDARLCHGGAGVRATRGWAVGVHMRWAAHVYLGEGVQEWDLRNQPECGARLEVADLQKVEGVGQENGERMGARMMTWLEPRLRAIRCRWLGLVVRADGALEV